MGLYNGALNSIEQGCSRRDRLGSKERRVRGGVRQLEENCSVMDGSRARRHLISRARSHSQGPLKREFEVARIPLEMTRLSCP